MSLNEKQVAQSALVAEFAIDAGRGSSGADVAGISFLVIVFRAWIS